MNAKDSGDLILGLDPRGLLARVIDERDRGTALWAWTAPSGAEIRSLFPQFEEIELIGRGGMGAVYRARQPELDRFVALKLLPADVAADEDFSERFRTEARALARLKHPHIVDIHDSGRTAEGHLFFVMEYVDGGDLSEVLARGALPPAHALKISAAICEALEYAHSRGVVHRDIKPANILLGIDGIIKVADFGLASLIGEAGGEAAESTIAGTTLGTPDYMSPEQRAGRGVDGRADLYSLGVMLYQMLTGQLPEGAWQPPSRKFGSSPRLDRVLEILIQPNPSARLQSAAELRSRLDRVRRAMTPAARKWRMAGSAGATILLAGAIWLWLAMQETGGHWPFAPAAAKPTPPASPASSKIIPLSGPGTLKPLDGLGLPTAALTGYWHWMDEHSGGTLAIKYTHEQPSAKVLHLPVNPGPRGYDLTCEVFFEHRGADLIFIFPAGQARPALVLDLYDHSGLELIRGASWMTNETTVARSLPYNHFLPLAMSVRPRGDRVAIEVRLEGRPFINWEGMQSDLSLPENGYPPAVVNHRGPVLTLSSIFGAARVRAMEVTILEK